MAATAAKEVLPDSSAAMVATPAMMTESNAKPSVTAMLNDKPGDTANAAMTATTTTTTTTQPSESTFTTTCNGAAGNQSDASTDEMLTDNPDANTDKIVSNKPSAQKGKFLNSRFSHIPGFSNIENCEKLIF